MKFVGKLSIVLLGLYFLLSYLFTHVLPHNYVFDRAHLQNIGKAVLAANPGASSDTILREMYKELKAEYGDYIAEWDEDEWVYNNAGNAMGSMLVLHASVTEYLIFFGTAVGTEGHTGVHFADDYFLILAGEQHAAYAHSRTPEVYLPGDSHHLPCGHHKQYRMPPDSWALELAQGWIPTMLPFGMLETFTSTMDIRSFLKTVRISAVHIVGNLLKGKI